jgi:uncharacterized protein YcgI (DUF1989 family)
MVNDIGKRRFHKILQPVSGKAVPVYKGEILRITLVDGPQCVDFNCFNLHDYKERMSVGHMKRTGFRAKKGDIIWSNPPRYSPMMAVLEMPETCLTDLLGARCHAAQLEKERGFTSTHTNCQDTIAECIGEYGLTPDDVHDSFNLWMYSGWDDLGNFFSNVRRNRGQKGDYIDFLALMDVLAVPAICGSGDVSNVSNYWFRPIKIEIFKASTKTKKLTQAYNKRHTGLKNQRKLEDFRVKDIRTERELKPIPAYERHFVNFPMKIVSFNIRMTEEDYTQLKFLQLRGLGDDDEDALRSAVMTWYTRNRTTQVVPNRIMTEAE